MKDIELEEKVNIVMDIQFILKHQYQLDSQKVFIFGLLNLVLLVIVIAVLVLFNKEIQNTYQDTLMNGHIFHLHQHHGWMDIQAIGIQIKYLR